MSNSTSTPGTLYQHLDHGTMEQKFFALQALAALDAEILRLRPVRRSERRIEVLRSAPGCTTAHLELGRIVTRCWPTLQSLLNFWRVPREYTAISVWSMKELAHATPAKLERVREYIRLNIDNLLRHDLLRYQSLRRLFYTFNIPAEPQPDAAAVDQVMTEVAQQEISPMTMRVPGSDSAMVTPALISTAQPDAQTSDTEDAVVAIQRAFLMISDFSQSLQSVLQTLQPHVERITSCRQPG